MPGPLLSLNPSLFDWQVNQPTSALDEDSWRGVLRRTLCFLAEGKQNQPKRNWVSPDNPRLCRDRSPICGSGEGSLEKADFWSSFGGASAKRGNLFMVMSTGFRIRDLILNPDPGANQLYDTGIINRFHWLSVPSMWKQMLEVTSPKVYNKG